MIKEMAVAAGFAIYIGGFLAWVESQPHPYRGPPVIPAVKAPETRLTEEQVRKYFLMPSAPGNKAPAPYSPPYHLLVPDSGSSSLKNRVAELEGRVDDLKAAAAK